MTDEMGDVDHTHPRTNESLGEAFRPGPTVAADGGERDATSEPEAVEVVGEDDQIDTMDDVDHTAGEAVSRTFERGGEDPDTV